MTKDASHQAIAQAHKCITTAMELSRGSRWKRFTLAPAITLNLVSAVVNGLIAIAYAIRDHGKELSE